MLPSMSTAATDDQAPRESSELARLRLRAEAAERRLNEVDLDLDRREKKFALQQLGLNIVRGVVWIASSWIPLRALQPIAESFAGQDTKFEASLTISLAVSIFLGIALAITYKQSRTRKAETERQRARMDQLEVQIEAQQREIQLGQTKSLPAQRQARIEQKGGSE